MWCSELKSLSTCVNISVFAGTDGIIVTNFFSLPFDLDSNDTCDNINFEGAMSNINGYSNVECTSPESRKRSVNKQLIMTLRFSTRLSAKCTTSRSCLLAEAAKLRQRVLEAQKFISSGRAHILATDHGNTSEMSIPVQGTLTAGRVSVSCGVGEIRRNYLCSKCKA